MIFRKLHSIKICFTVNSWSPSHWSHNGGLGLFSILNECVKRIWPVQRQLIITSSFLFVHPEKYLSSIWGMMACSLLSNSLSHRSYHKDEINGWIFIKKHLYVVDLGQVRRWERGKHQPSSGGESRRAVTWSRLLPRTFEQWVTYFPW